MASAWRETASFPVIERIQPPHQGLHGNRIVMSLSHDTPAGISSTAPAARPAPGLLGRVRGMLFAPETEWLLVARESITQRRLFFGYVIPLAGLAALLELARFSLFLRAPLASVVTVVALTLGFEVMCVYVVSLIINAVAHYFRGVPRPGQALKVAAYASTPLWLSAVIIPFPTLSVPLQFLAGLYHTYLMYLGLMSLMKSPRDRALGYATTVVLCSIILGIVFVRLSASLGEALHLGHFRVFG
jgi:hypothetical protein